MKRNLGESEKSSQVIVRVVTFLVFGQVEEMMGEVLRVEVMGLLMLGEDILFPMVLVGKVCEVNVWEKDLLLLVEMEMIGLLTVKVESLVMKVAPVKVSLHLLLLMGKFLGPFLG